MQGTEAHHNGIPQTWTHSTDDADQKSKTSTNACYEWANLPRSDDRSGTIDGPTRLANQYVRPCRARRHGTMGFHDLGHTRMTTRIRFKSQHECML